MSTNRKYTPTIDKKSYYDNVLPRRNQEKIFTNKVFHTMNDEQKLKRLLSKYIKYEWWTKSKKNNNKVYKKSIMKKK